MLYYTVVMKKHIVLTGLVFSVSILITACGGVSKGDLVGVYYGEYQRAGEPAGAVTLALYDDAQGRMLVSRLDGSRANARAGEWHLDGSGDLVLSWFQQIGERPVARSEAELMQFAVRSGRDSIDLAIESSDGLPWEGEDLVLQQTRKQPAGRLEGSSWQLQEIRLDNGEVLAPADGECHTFEFGENSRMSGQADCNRIMGSYAFVDSYLVFSRPAATMAMCMPPSLFNRFVQTLNRVYSWDMDNERLMVNFRGGEDGGRFSSGGVLVMKQKKDCR